MTAPPYDWICQKCQRKNAAHSDSCVACGFSACFTVTQLDATTLKEEGSDPVASKRTNKKELYLWTFVIPGHIVYGITFDSLPDFVQAPLLVVLLVTTYLLVFKGFTSFFRKGKNK